MNNRIFVALSTFAEHGEEPLELLAGSGFIYKVNSLGRRLLREEVIEMGRDCQGIIAGLEPYDKYVLDNLPELKCISRCGVGIDNISLNTARQRNIEVFNTPDVVIQPVAELTVAMIFDLLRELTFQTNLLKSGRWEKRTGSLLKGKKVGILGLGRIGRRTAEILSNLSAEVSATDIVPDREWAKHAGVRIVSLDELLGGSDILSLHLSFSENNPFCLGDKEIALMKNKAMVVNVSRGNFVDEDALYNALREKRLAGAALDVFRDEPYGGKLCELDNVVLTPHIATLTKESRLQMEIESTKNLINFLSQ